MFNKKIKNLRKSAGISQEELAEMLNVTRQAVTKWESGCVVPDILNVIKMSELFKVTIDSLVKEEDCRNDFFSNKQDMGQCQSFVYLAKQHTYAANGQSNRLKLRQGSKDYQFQLDDFSYHDSYVGNECFVGEEVVYQRQQPVWALTYSGKVLSDHFSSSFLKEALQQVPETIPFRGPSHYSNGQYYYHCQTEGAFEWFQGSEVIYYEQEKVFELFFHGGELK